MMAKGDAGGSFDQDRLLHAVGEKDARGDLRRGQIAGRTQPVGRVLHAVDRVGHPGCLTRGLPHGTRRAHRESVARKILLIVAALLVPGGFIALIAAWALRAFGQSARGRQIIALAARYRLPTVYPWRFFAELGGLLSYGNEQIDSFRLAATYVDRILRGAKPGELPVQAPVKFEMVINMKTAKALGLNVPLHLQQRADKVIE